MRGLWQGADAIYKVRKPLSYRLRALDDAIRRQRTVREAEMLHAAKGARVPAPYLYDVDVPGSTIVMEYVEGERLRDALTGYPAARAKAVFEELGRLTASLHSAGMVHGDLTTANVVVRGTEVVLIDFGLSFRTTRLEDQAVDLRLIKETVTGGHPDRSKAALDSIFRGYSERAGGKRFREVTRQLRSIERRGRYARVT